MKWVRAWVGFIFVSSVSFGLPTETSDLSFRTCLRQGLRKNSPPDRDNAKLICLEKFTSISLLTCSLEAKKMEYLSNTEKALKSCYFSRPRAWNTMNCLNVAKKMSLMTDRDNVRLDCFSQLELQQMSRKNCFKIYNSFEQMHYKERYQQVCQEY